MSAERKKRNKETVQVTAKINTDNIQVQGKHIVRHGSGSTPDTTLMTPKKKIGNDPVDTEDDEPTVTPRSGVKRLNSLKNRFNNNKNSRKSDTPNKRRKTGKTSSTKQNVN